MIRSEDFFRPSQLPPYPLGEIADAVTAARVDGVDIVDLSQVNPNLPPPGFAVDKLVQASLQEHNHRYSSSQGISRLREAFGSWYRNRFQVELDPKDEIVSTMGSKEGISHLLMSIISPGDTVIVPSPSYPIHMSSVSLAGGALVGIPLFASMDEARDSQHFLDDSSSFFERLELTLHRTWPRPRLMILNFPHNPTATSVDLSFFTRLVEFAKSNSMLLVHDFAYADISFGRYKPPSLLSVPGAKDVAVECYSLSKGMNLAGWRIGCCVGNRSIIAALKKVKSYLDFGTFQPLQIAAAHLLGDQEQLALEHIKFVSQEYRERRDILAEGLKELGWDVDVPLASVFLWGRIPQRYRHLGSLSMGHFLLKEAQVAVCPGVGFDVDSNEYIRFALVEKEHRLRSALVSIQQATRRESSVLPASV
jgi:alanine-synthesizing transaminase